MPNGVRRQFHFEYGRVFRRTLTALRHNLTPTLVFAIVILAPPQAAMLWWSMSHPLGGVWLLAFSGGVTMVYWCLVVVFTGALAPVFAADIGGDRFSFVERVALLACFPPVPARKRSGITV